MRVYARLAPKVGPDVPAGRPLRPRSVPPTAGRPEGGPYRRCRALR
jgi:hypothetical protein